jgi:hypothetical protein
MEATHGGTPPLSSPMSIHNTNHDGTTADRKERRYAELNIGEDEFVIYDRENHQAWIQSSVSVSITEQC